MPQQMLFAESAGQLRLEAAAENGHGPARLPTTQMPAAQAPIVLPSQAPGTAQVPAALPVPVPQPMPAPAPTQPAGRLAARLAPANGIAQPGVAQQLAGRYYKPVNSLTCKYRLSSRKPSFSGQRANEIRIFLWLMVFIMRPQNPKQCVPACSSNAATAPATNKLPTIRTNGNTDNTLAVTCQPEQAAAPAPMPPAQSFPTVQPASAPPPFQAAPQRRVAPTPISGAFPPVNPAQMVRAQAGTASSRIA